MDQDRKVAVVLFELRLVLALIVDLCGMGDVEYIEFNHEDRHSNSES